MVTSVTHFDRKFTICLASWLASYVHVQLRMGTVYIALILETKHALGTIKTEIPQLWSCI